MKNLCGKTRKVNEPYEVWRNDSGWEWRVLKKWQAPDKEPTATGRFADPKTACARWFCAVTSPIISPRYETGDVYVLDIIRNAVRIDNPVLDLW